MTTISKSVKQENQIRLRALHLEKENIDLRTELVEARQELSSLRVCQLKT